MCRKHMHPNTNEIQYILEGTGTIWLGDKEVQVKPGDLIVIPKGTAAWRHQAGRPLRQGDRDQDPAAGAGRYQDAELTAVVVQLRRHARASSRGIRTRLASSALVDCRVRAADAPRNDG